MSHTLRCRSRWLGLAAVASMVALLGLSTVQAEGSRTLYPTGASGARASLEWANNSVVGGIGFRRTVLRVYAQQGEVILLGSGAMGVYNAGSAGAVTPTTSRGDIAVFAPGVVPTPEGTSSIPALSSAVFLASRDQPTRGFIASRAEEVAGPDRADVSGGDNAALFNPAYYVAPSTGVYSVVLTGPVGQNSASTGAPSGSITAPNVASSGGTPLVRFNASMGTNIDLWDVTVRSSLTSTTDLNGRVFTYLLANFTGQNGRQLFYSVFPVTPDGYRYQVRTKGLDPNGFTLYANGQGYLDTNGALLYRDIKGNDPNLASIQGGVSIASPSYPMFLSAADTAAIGGLGIPLAPTKPQFTTLPTFVGNLISNTSRFAQGGTFQFASNVPGNFQIIVSRNGTDFDPTNPLNRVIRGVLPTAGPQSVAWDGRATDGTFFPAGLNYKTRLIVQNGEVHFPLGDAENSVFGGPSITLLNETYGGGLPADTAYYDDRGYRTAAGTLVGTAVNTVLCGINPPPAPHRADPFNGFASNAGGDTATNGRNWGQTGNNGNDNADCTGSFGDMKGLDTWAYYPSDTKETSLNIVLDPPTAKRLISATLVVGSPTRYDLVYEIRVDNPGGEAVNSFQISDNLNATFGSSSYTIQVAPSVLSTVPASTPYSLNASFNGGTQPNLLASGQVLPAASGVTPSSVVLRFTVRVTPPSTPISYNNSATSSGVTITSGVNVSDLSTDGSNPDPDGDGNPGNNSTPTPVTLGAAGGTTDLSVAKTLDNPSPKVGELIKFSVTVSNASSGVNATGVQVTDLLPAGYTYVPASSTIPAGTSYTASSGLWNVGALNAGTSRTLILAATLNANASASSPSNVTNTASLTASTPTDNNPSNNSSSVTPTLPAKPTLTKAFSPNPAIRGNRVILSLTVTNPNAYPLTRLTLSDPFPSGLSVASPPNLSNGCGGTPTGGTAGATSVGFDEGTLPSGGSCTISVDVTSASGSFANVANGVGSNQTGTPGTGASSTLVVNPGADLRVTKTASNLAPTATGTFSYTVTVQNLGPDPATSVSVAEALPATLTLLSSSATQGSYSGSTWSVGTLALNASATLTLNVQAAGVLETRINTASASSAVGDPVPGNNSASVITNKLVLEKRQRNVTQGGTLATAPLTARPGDTLEYCLLLKNFFPASITPSALSDQIPTQTTFQALGTVPPGASGSLQTVGGFPTVVFASFPALGPGNLLNPTVQTYCFTVTVK